MTALQAGFRYSSSLISSRAQVRVEVQVLFLVVVDGGAGKTTDMRERISASTANVLKTMLLQEMGNDCAIRSGRLEEIESICRVREQRD